MARKTEGEERAPLRSMISRASAAPAVPQDELTLPPKRAYVLAPLAVELRALRNEKPAKTNGPGSAGALETALTCSLVLSDAGPGGGACKASLSQKQFKALVRAADHLQVT